MWGTSCTCVGLEGVPLPGVSERRGALLEGPLKGILFYFGYKRGIPVFF